MSNIHLDVEVYGGSDCFATCGDLIDLANRLQVTVHAQFNDVKLMAIPGADQRELYLAWQRENAKPSGPYKIACHHPERDKK